jgi:hypothetical protein
MRLLSLSMFTRNEAIKRIASGRCACADCPGRLTDPARSKGGWGFCRACGCAWQIATPDGHAYAATVPSAMHREMPIKTKKPGAP